MARLLLLLLPGMELLLLLLLWREPSLEGDPRLTSTRCLALTPSDAM